MTDSEIRYIFHGMFENHELRFSERTALKQIIDEIDGRDQTRQNLVACSHPPHHPCELCTERQEVPELFPGTREAFAKLSVRADSRHTHEMSGKDKDILDTALRNSVTTVGEAQEPCKAVWHKTMYVGKCPKCREDWKHSAEQGQNNG